MKRIGMDDFKMKFWRWLAFRVSKHLVYWATLRLMINPTNGKYSGQPIPDISTHEALRRWARSVYCEVAEVKE